MLAQWLRGLWRVKLSLETVSMHRKYRWYFLTIGINRTKAELSQLTLEWREFIEMEQKLLTAIQRLISPRVLCWRVAISEHLKIEIGLNASPGSSHYSSWNDKAAVIKLNSSISSNITLSIFSLNLSQILFSDNLKFSHARKESRVPMARSAIICQISFIAFFEMLVLT